jgi:hypothetical protein
MALRIDARVVGTVRVWLASAIFICSAGCADSPTSTSGPVGASGAGVNGLAGIGGAAGTSAVVTPVAGAAAGTAGTGGAAGTGSNAGASGVRGSGSGGEPSVGGGGNGGASGVAGGSAGAAGTAAGPSFPSVSDLGGDGPYESMTVENSGPNNNYTIYRPAQLAPGGAKNPIVGWMSGGGSTPSQYSLLPHLATHGFVVVASNTAPALGNEVALGEEIIAGIDWILMENAASGSPFFGTLDETKIASMGYSMGALATTAIAGDPRLTTTVHISGGNMQTDRIAMLHAPAAFICGASGADIAGANCATDFEAATTPVFYGVFNGGDHLGVRTAPYSDRIRLVVTGWLRWQLMQDASLESMFVGDMCTVCEDPNWTVKQKGLM